MTALVGPASSGHSDAPPRPGAALDLAWYEVADALWLAARTADRSDDPRPPSRPEPAPGRPSPPVEARPDDTTSGPTPDPAPVESPQPEATAPTPATDRDVPAGDQEPTAAPSGPGPDPAQWTDPRWRRDPGPVLPGAQAISRALRPLKQHVASRHEQVLDEEATAERAADDPIWLPVLQPADERRWDALIVVDDHISMTVWRETVAEFLALLRRQGAFRTVGVRLLHTDAKRPADVTLRGPGGGLASDPAELLTGNSQRLVLVITDGTGPAWHAGAVLPVLRTWAHRMPVGILHLLPRQQWHRTGLQPRRMRLRAAATGAANARLAWDLRDPVADLVDDWGRPIGEDAIPVPVMQLSPHWLTRWAGLVAGARTGWTELPAVLAVPWQEPDVADRWRMQASVTDPRQRVREFTSSATPTALALATRLAAAPLNLPLMRALQRALVPTSDVSHLSEILSSGLIHQVAPPEEVADPGRVTFEFDHGVREELLAVGRRGDTARVLRVVDDYLGESVPAVRGLSQALDDPANAPERDVTADNRPFRLVEQTVFQALSGPYLPLSRQLEAALSDENPAWREGATTADRHTAVTMQTPRVSNPSRSGGPDVSSSTVAPAQVRPAPPSTAPVIWGNVPPRNPNFTGRATLLDHLHERMQAGTTAVLPQALHGMGGVGKSQLATEYVYRHQDDYDLIWWVPAERPAQIGAALVELAQRMDLPVGPEANTAVPAVREALRLGKPYTRWLLVFDNAESPESVRGYFPSGGPGSIMVTSRNPQWANVARPLEVDVFTREESIELLRRRGPELDDDAADRLAEALGDLPLALEQAAAWRAETGMPADEYLRLFEEKRTELLEVSAPVDYQLPVAAAWNVSLDRLAVSNPAALRLLQVCSFFAPEPIARTLISGAHGTDIHPELNTALRDPMGINRAIREINRYALAKIDYRTNSIQMHRLIQAVLIDRLSESERESMRRSAHLLLASSDRNDPTLADNWRIYSELYPHLVASEAHRSTDPWVQQLVNNEAHYLYWWGDHDAALELTQRAYDARRELIGADAPATLEIGRWLGFLLFTVGMFAESATFNEEILAAYQRTSNEDTEALFSATGAVAAGHRMKGDFAAALEIDEDNYARSVRALGVEDPATLNTAHNLAVSVRLVGDLTRAQDIDHRTQQARVRLFGEDHPVTLLSTNNLIIDRRELGDYVTARAEQQEVVDRLRQTMSPGHPQTLRALRSLSTAIRKAGDHAAARDVSDEVRAGFVTRYGEDHPDTVAATLNLSIDLRQCGEWEAAAEFGAQAHDRYRRLLGEDHPHTLAAAANLAVTQRLRGNIALARQSDEEGIRVLTRRVGPDHRLTLACAVNLASDLYAQGDITGAHERDADTARRLREVFGEDHPTTLACLGNLAMDLAALGRTDEANEILADTVARFRRILGDAHPATVAAADLALRANCDLDPMPL